MGRAERGGETYIPACVGCGRSNAQQRLIESLRNSLLRLQLENDFLKRGAPVKAANIPDHVYVLARLGENKVKLGISNDPEGRCRSLCNDPEDNLRVVFSEFVGGDRARRIERRCHSALRGFRVSGNGSGREWFRVDVEMAVRAFKSAAAAIQD